MNALLTVLAVFYAMDLLHRVVLLYWIAAGRPEKTQRSLGVVAGDFAVNTVLLVWILVLLFRGVAK